MAEQKHGFLQFSKKLDYGLFFLIELAGQKSPQAVSLRKFCADHQIPFFFMQKVAMDRRKNYHSKKLLKSWKAQLR